MKRSTTLATLAQLAVSGRALAHPDHLSGGDYGLAHLLSDPFHLALAAGAVAFALWLRRAVLRRREARERAGR